MYCKFCGNKIASNVSQCPHCGSRINLADGGQTFYAENELDSWMTGSGSDIPRTEIRPIPKRGKNIPNRKQQKSSGSNKLIVFCIVSALVIVLLVVTIMYVKNRNDVKDTEVTSDEIPAQSSGEHGDINEAIGDLARGKVPTDTAIISDGNNITKNNAENDAKGKIVEVDKAEAEAKAKADKAKANASKNSKGNTNSKDKSKETTGEAKKQAAQEQPKAPSTGGGSAVGGSGSNSNTSGGNVTIPSIPDGGENSKENLEIEKPKVVTEENAPGIRR